MNKSPDAFRTISEVADDLDIPQHVLRFWETRFSSIRPLKRGGGRRYYRPDDVELLKGIRQLLYGQGYTIKGVQRILKEDGLRFVQGVGRGELSGIPGPGDDVEDPEDLLARDRFDAPGSSAANDDGAERASPSSTRPVSVPLDRGATDPGLGSANIDRLRSALDELIECQRVLQGVRRG